MLNRREMIQTSALGVAGSLLGATANAKLHEANAEFPVQNLDRFALLSTNVPTLDGYLHGGLRKKSLVVLLGEHTARSWFIVNTSLAWGDSVEFVSDYEIDGSYEVLLERLAIANKDNKVLIYLTDDRCIEGLEPNVFRMADVILKFHPLNHNLSKMGESLSQINLTKNRYGHSRSVSSLIYQYDKSTSFDENVLIVTKDDQGKPINSEWAKIKIPAEVFVTAFGDGRLPWSPRVDYQRRKATSVEVYSGAYDLPIYKYFDVKPAFVYRELSPRIWTCWYDKVSPMIYLKS